MCGIVGYTGYREACDIVMDCLRKLEYRGYDSAGIALADGRGRIDVIKEVGRLDRLAKKIAGQDPIPSHCGIGHTRWATHGAPSVVNSHPHSAEHVTIVHNGIIENYLTLKDFLQKGGYSFESETDTEVLAKLIDFYYSGDPLAAIQKALSRVRGSYGLAILFNDFPDRIYAARKDSPLIVGYGKGENFLASDIPALLKYTREYSVLEEGEIALIQPDGITVYDEFGKPAEKKHLTAEWDVEAAEKGGYEHFMLKEIHEQPSVILKTVGARLEDGLPDFHLANLSDEYLKSIPKIHIVACGSAMHVGMVGKALIEKLARVPVDVAIASEFRYSDPILGRDDLVIIISQSGETIDTIAALRLAAERGIRTLGIVNVVGSSIARMVDDVMYIYAGPEIAVATTKAYSAQLAMMYLIAFKLAFLRGELSESQTRAYCADLIKVPSFISKLLENTDGIKHLSAQFMSSEHMFYIGRGLDYAMSLEASLKLKEVSYIHSEAYAAGEMKHGTISLISEGTPVIALATQDAIFEKTLSNVKEVRSRGARVLLLCKDGMDVPDGLADFVYRMPAFNELFMPLMSIPVMQLFAYYTAVLRGCDVDKPRNLAKSVTVE